MPRVKLFDEQEALGQALELFWEKGYEATSLSDLTATLGIGKGSFYDTFESKRRLFDRCLSVYQSSSLEVLDGILVEKSDPVHIISRLLNKHTELMLNDSSARGCFIANSTAELADDAAIQLFLEKHNQIMRSKLIKLLANSQYTTDAGAFADLIITHLTGISVMSKFMRDSARFKLANQSFMKVFD